MDSGGSAVGRGLGVVVPVCVAVLTLGALRWHGAGSSETLLTLLLTTIAQVALVVGLFAAAVGLWYGEYDDAAVARIGVWCLLGTVVIGLGVGVVAGHRWIGGFELAEVVLTLAGGGGVGALTGIALGHYDARIRQQTRQVAETQQRLSQIADHVDEIIWMANDDLSEVLYISPAFERVHDTPREAVYENPRRILDDIHEDDRAHVRAVLDELVSAAADADPDGGEMVYRVVGPDGEVRWMEGSVYPVFDEDGTVTSFVGAATDVTDQREREATLREQNRKLDAFASIVSHDLRNPLNIATGHLELARETGDPEHFEKVASAHDRMARLIDDLLAVARAGTAEFDPTEVNLGVVAREAWEAVATDAASLDASDATLVADRDALLRVLENLLRNAVEHAGPDVAVRVGPLDDGEGFYVADDGPGVPEEFRSTLFETGASDGGSGLGLRIVADVAAGHGWDVSLADTDGGARFEIRGVERAAGPEPDAIAEE